MVKEILYFIRRTKTQRNIHIIFPSVESERPDRLRIGG